MQIATTKVLSSLSSDDLGKMVDITGYRGTRKLIEIDSYSQTCAVIDYHVGEERILVVDSDRVSVPE